MDGTILGSNVHVLSWCCSHVGCKIWLHFPFKERPADCMIDNNDHDGIEGSCNNFEFSMPNAAVALATSTEKTKSDINIILMELQYGCNRIC